MIFNRLNTILLFLSLVTANTFFAQTVGAGQDRSICAGDSVQLQAEDGMSYAWSPSASLSDTTIANPIATPTATTQYILNAMDLSGNISIDTVTVFVINSLSISAGADQSICFGESITIGEDPQLDVTYTWSPTEFISDDNISNPTASPEESTTYIVTAQNGSCTAEDAVTITVENFNIDFEYMIFPSCESFEIQLVNKSDPANYQWNFWTGESTNEVNPTIYAQPNEFVFITLRETTSQCNFDITKEIDFGNIDDYINFSATNVFSPNGDGINDFMSIGIDGNLEDCMEFTIYNRWGERIFVSTGGNSRWDGYTIAGQLAAPGTYFYSVSIKGVEHKGTVQLYH